MLFRLRMSIDSAIEAYRQFSERIFSKKKWFFQDGKYKATRFEEAIRHIIRNAPSGGDSEVLLLEEIGPKWYGDNPYI